MVARSCDLGQGLRGGGGGGGDDSSGKPWAAALGGNWGSGLAPSSLLLLLTPGPEAQALTFSRIVRSFNCALEILDNPGEQQRQRKSFENFQSRPDASIGRFFSSCSFHFLFKPHKGKRMTLVVCYVRT